LLLLLLSHTPICHALWPEFLDPAAEASQLFDAVKDAVQIARVVAATFNDCDTTYNRYFRQRDSQLVRHFFQRITDIPLDTAINADSLEEVFNKPIKDGLREKYAKLSISYGPHPNRPDQSDPDPCTSHRRFAQMENGRSENGMITVCERTFRLPLSSEIENSPAGARTRGAILDHGFSCDGLGYNDSGWMKTMGSTLLHELMHWSYPFDDLSDFHYDIEESDLGYTQITDFVNVNPQPDWPPKGYGPYYSAMLRDLENDGMSSKTLQNVDNCVYYAVSKYCSFTYKKTFGPATSQNDTVRYRGRPSRPGRSAWEPRDVSVDEDVPPQVN
ncbi:uncharacterized protein A1O9_07658, partial [Exophiala aquamarina CBS 119918]